MKKITFTLPAEALGTASEALLLGDFNEWNLDNAIGLSVQPDGSLAASVELEPGKTYEYRFLLNNGTWINDWNAQQYIHNQSFGVENSAITVPAEIIKEKATPKAKAIATKTVTKKATAPKAKKEKIEPSVKDDLTKIEGIGNKITKLLEAEGITTFAALGKATGKKLKAILETAGPKFQLHDPASWPKQAKLAAAEKWDELKALQDKLVAGK
ncbi:glycoside hydrolase family 13 [Niabella ginsengisoli]|uniref:Glycoside hydrolase family 13 n=1 Tax=Niabella ginsengisoli TaxID=522298 RepID=A0ABS9SPA8_9BACT|nr:glycoside hydrolase family 13 [Niabella ginsengisoli]MCH5600202.1 glycoside hydrolase family 13 [Niabella ginsengisoli]